MNNRNFRTFFAAFLTGTWFFAAFPVAAAEWRADAAYVYDDNVTRGAGAYALSGQAISASLGVSGATLLAEHLRVVTGGTLFAERYLHHSGLGRISAEAQAELQYRADADFGTPLYALYARLAADAYRSAQRDGSRFVVGASVRTTLTDRLRLFAALAHNTRHGRVATFDLADNGVRFNLDYDLPASGTLYGGVEYRRGDMVVVAPWWNTYGNAWAADDVFGGALYNYRLDGKTRIITLGYNYPLSSRAALDVSWRQARSSASYLALYGSAPWTWWGATSLDYTSNQYAVVFLARF